MKRIYQNTLRWPAIWMTLGFIFLNQQFTFGQLAINEVCPANFSGIADEDDDFEDWIELYNGSSDTINLKDYTITDNPERPDKWVFPEIKIAPQDYMIIFASDKDRRRVIRKYKTAVFATDTFSYLNPTSEPPAAWRSVAFQDTAWLSGPGGFGHGEGIYNTLVSDTLMSVFLRKTFEIQDSSSIVNAQLHVDYDDSFVAFLNGTEIARANIRPDGAIPEYNQAAWHQHNSAMLTGGLPELFTIQNDELEPLLVEGKNLLAIQLHNNWIDAEMSINSWLSFGLTTDSGQFLDTPEWFFHDTLRLHTDFKLDSQGESVLLFDPEENMISRLDFPEIQVDQSFGRIHDGHDSCVYFPNPSPGNANQSSEPYYKLIDQMPGFSANAGFYNLDTGDTLKIALSAPDSTFTIRYSLDGSTPSDTSAIATDSIHITQTKALRARLFKPGWLPGKTATHTYIINKTTNLPVVSVCTNPDDLWDDNKGIYVKGPDADPVFPHYGANFWEDKEIVANWALFDPDQQLVFQQDAGLKIHGGWSRAFPLKSLRLTARSDFGLSEFEHPFFPDKNISNFKSLILRNAGNDFQGAHLRDALVHKMVFGATNLPIQDYLPVVVYLNGEYWGIQNLRERISETYLDENFALDSDKVDLLENECEVIEGDNQEFINLFHFIQNHDLSLDENYAYVDSQLDIANVIDYFAVELFIVNTDWPQNNVKFWKQDDGKWQYIFLDADNSMAFISSLQNYTINAYERILEDPATSHAKIFSQLLENDNFRHQFINRSADLMNSIFNPVNALNFIDTYKDSLITEMAFHKAKWGGTVNVWLTYHIENKLNTFFTYRPNHVRDHTLELFNLSATYRLYLHTENAQGSHIRINSIIPETYPWHGYYFDSVPVKLKALPAPGMTFSHWEENGEPVATDQEIWWHLAKHDTLTAFFSGTPDTLKPIITEINFSSHENMDVGDWIELYNPNQESLDISGWQLKNDLNFNWFTFNAGTIIQPESFLVVAQDTGRFCSIYPEMATVTGSFNFGLRSSAAAIRLYDENENLIVNLAYSSTSPWPEHIANTGRTIELIDPGVDMQNPENWQAGCLGGSPGKAPTECHENPNIIFTEFNYKALDCFDTKDWVEIFNYDTVQADLSFWQFKDDHANHIFSLPYGTLLNPGTFLILCSDTAAFGEYYSDSVRAIGNFDFGLSSSGDHLRLYDPYDNLISEVDYLSDAPWPQQVSGTGRTAEINNINENTNVAENWRDGCLGGSPGKFPGPCHDTAHILVTEINYSPHNIFDSEDWFEIYNHDTIPISLAGWSFRDGNPSHAYHFPDNLIIMPGGYLVVVEDSLAFAEIYDTIPNFVGAFDFGLSGDADEINLVDQFGQTIVQIAYQSSPPWPENDFAPGRTLELLDYDAEPHDPANWFLGCFNGSPGKAYTPCPGSAGIIVSEIKYDSDENTNSGDWFEIFNAGAEQVSLYGWTFSDANPEHQYPFPDDLVMPPNDYLVVVQDSSEFLSVHDTIPNFVGEFDFGLSSDGDEINLFDGYRNEVVQLSYQTSAPWPENPFAPGRSFELVDYYGEQHEPSNWKLGCSLGSPGETWFECDDVSVLEIDNPDFSYDISPNPFDDQFVITIKSSKQTNASIRLFDSRGQITEIIFDGQIHPEERTINVETSSLKSGIYLLQLKTNKSTMTTKMVKI